MNTRSPSVARADAIHASSWSAVADVYRSGSGDWSRNIGLNPRMGLALQLADGADSLVALHGVVVPGTDMSPDTRPAVPVTIPNLRPGSPHSSVTPRP